MITNADAFIPEFVDAGADYLTVHVEACPHLHRTIQSIKERGVKAGVTLKSCDATLCAAGDLGRCRSGVDHVGESWIRRANVYSIGAEEDCRDSRALLDQVPKPGAARSGWRREAGKYSRDRGGRSRRSSSQGPRFFRNRDYAATIAAHAGGWSNGRLAASRAASINRRFRVDISTLIDSLHPLEIKVLTALGLRPAGTPLWAANS